MRIKKSQLVTVSYSLVPGNVLIRKVERKSQRKKESENQAMKWRLAGKKKGKKRGKNEQGNRFQKERACCVPGGLRLTHRDQL